MTLVRLGYVAMSVLVKDCSPSQTMTHAQYSKFEDQGVARSRLERISRSNLENCLRLLKHNRSYNIDFFRLSSRLIPLATHPELEGWDYLSPLKKQFLDLGEHIAKNDLRIDFHPDHFVLLNSPKEEVLKESIKNLSMHIEMLKQMGIDPVHRCVLHIGGKYNNAEKALEAFIANWAKVPTEIQQSIMLENDDKSFHLQDTLYLCEKLGIPLVFDYHHHVVNNKDKNWEQDWQRVIGTWSNSELPIKMHISSPKSEKQFRHHADFIDVRMFSEFLQKIKGSVGQIDCMVEAKQKDKALLKLMKDLKGFPEIKVINEANFNLR